MPSLDELCPPYVGDQRISLQLAPWSPAPLALAPVILLVSYAATLSEGLVLPLIFSVSSPSAATLVRRVVRRVPPSALSFTPREGGRHLVRLGELAHNRWWGSLLVLVAGDPPEPS